MKFFSFDSGSFQQAARGLSMEAVRHAAGFPGWDSGSNFSKRKRKKSWPTGLPRLSPAQLLEGQIGGVG